MIAKLNKITNWQAALIIAILGFTVFSTGLVNQFWNDDITQIVNSLPVHSITNIRLFFEGGTFYNGHGLVPLSGVYYRPLMITVFSLLYTLFGAHPIAFHLFQLSLCIGSAIVLYLFFRYSFKAPLALFLSLVFLLHPIDSQGVFTIASMQDALFFFFGILALYFLLRFSSIKSLIAVAACLFLSLLSKESGILFVAMSLLYLFWWDRKRLYSFIGIMVLPIALFLALRINAVGLIGHSNNAPIDSLNLSGRLLTAPSVLLFYITKFIFPWKLATAYYWVYPTFSCRHVLLPLAIDLTTVALVIYLAFVLRKKASKAMFFTYLYFTAWSVFGLLMLLQIIPLDMTASEVWFYFPMAGVLGMAGVVLTVFPLRIRPSWLLIIAVLVISTLGIRTATRGLDWRNPYSLAYKDVATSREDYAAYTSLAGYLIERGNFSQAKAYAERSISIYPSYASYNDLGLASNYLGDYPEAVAAYSQGVKLYDSSTLYENLGALTLVYGSPGSNKQFLLSAVDKFPQDYKLWLYLAILEDRYNDNAGAKVAISNAANYGQVPQFIYDHIMNNQPFTLNLGNTGKSIVIQ
jgi:hypothetical protein